MEEKKFDAKTLIGFLLIFGLFVLWFNTTQPTAEELEAQKKEQQKTEAATVDNKQEKETTAQEPVLNLSDSTAVANYKSKIGAFGYTPALEGTTVLENNVLYLRISNKGGQIVEAKMKNFVTYDSLPVHLVKDNNASFGLTFSTSDNRVLDTKDLYFEPSISKNGNNTVLSMKAKVSATDFLEYRYEIKPDEYLLDFNIRSQGLNGVLNSAAPIALVWKQKGIRHSKSATYENRYTRLTYNHDDGNISKLSESSDDEEEEVDVKWLSYRQHFFSSILATDKHFETAKLSSVNLVEDDTPETKFTKENTAVLPLKADAGELSYNMNLYYGPTDIKELSKYKELGLEDSIPYGWGIFGFINRYVFTPAYTFLSSFLPYGIAIIVMTILVRLLMSPVTYKSYLSQAKMKVLKPEIAELGEKYKDNPMKKQQETMKLYNKAGASPMSGCLPALLQLPVFYALFMFFPTSFALRQKPFLWADDLSSYDIIAELPFHIPLYGDHVSLFPILASIAIFFYMMMTSGQNMQQQPGMPNMKFILYLSPLMMLIFFNSYASGLSLYYFVSNLITIFIMLAIKKFIIDEDKIHAKIQENKKKPKKENKFQKKMREMMEQAEEQKKNR
ncbi:membrane protein [Cellulophaga lytica]|uniref:Membrane protein insertase YidC n=1 Tax=Cellulophaga lytica (strain ATCC 23178 / DSM 7489 / JCM 8516 / NBRC 14961 / NCIMB 1423 / VKM B-1433 / Cy l20) TaxID=867900 RepID=F0RH16_CELLC|nr:membrane protein insertase YidC [Cellulophaga lytica]ADY28054.1 Membrane protein oxaA [Cellulophaga lytica DSM 7489]AIM59131.1 membrane protein [Cellulophaga lytica]APU08937.1 membrane protein insertase YidC [Cellulophaga lytica]WQG77757.1 membrane protein insertase YidC [Cellulophaga lytica]